MRVRFLLMCVGVLFYSRFAFAQYHMSRFEAHNVMPRDVMDNSLISLLLQGMMDQVKGKGFRQIGVEEDFFHGHLLYSEDSEVSDKGVMKPFAVLYHTQEEASRISKEAPGSRYDYLDRKARNWLQLIDEKNVLSKKIYNAYSLMLDRMRSSSQSEQSLAATKSHFTVFSTQLDFHKFPEGFKKKIIGSRQMNFFLHPCSDTREIKLKDNMTESEVFDFLYSTGTVTLKDSSAGESLCLKTNFTTFYIPESEERPRFYEDPFVLNDAVPTDYTDIVANVN